MEPKQAQDPLFTSCCPSPLASGWTCLKFAVLLCSMLLHLREVPGDKPKLALGSATNHHLNLVGCSFL
jgi:hypothetical protein